MNESSRRVLVEILERCRAEIVDRGTDWVRQEAVDLGTARPRDETRSLVERVVMTQAAVLLDGNEKPLDEFVEFVTSFRVSREFHVSTLLRGMLSFRSGIAGVLRREIQDGWAVLTLIGAVDEVAQRAILRTADVYNDKLNHKILVRRAELEEELARTTADKERELDEKIRTIDAQREMLNALSSPVLRVWEGVLLVPLIGEIDDARAEAVRERVLNEVVATKSGVVLVDITGLSVTDEQLAGELLRLVRCVRLLGADVMLVGMSPEGARALTSLPIALDDVYSFATRKDGLRAALRRAGARVTRA
jgi:rsbT co-antagonist protein RsbR